jgi:hypothetical protein
MAGLDRLLGDSAALAAVREQAARRRVTAGASGKSDAASDD